MLLDMSPTLDHLQRENRGFSAKLVGWQSVAEPGGQLGGTIVSGAGGVSEPAPDSTG